MSRQPGTPSLAPDSVLAQRSSLTSFTSIPSLRCPFRTSVMTVPLGRAQADLCRIPRPLAHASGVCPVWSLFLGLLRSQPFSISVELSHRPDLRGGVDDRQARSRPRLVLLAATCFGQRVGAFAIGYLNDVLKEDVRRGDGPLFAVDRGVNNRAQAPFFGWSARPIGGHQAGARVDQARQSRAAGPRSRMTRPGSQKLIVAHRGSATTCRMFAYCLSIGGSHLAAIIA
jgi:hypothetical protein